MLKQNITGRCKQTFSPSKFVKKAQKWFAEKIMTNVHDSSKVMESNPIYLLKSSLLYFVLQISVGILISMTFFQLRLYSLSLQNTRIIHMYNILTLFFYFFPGRGTSHRSSVNSSLNSSSVSGGVGGGSQGNSSGGGGRTKSSKSSRRERGEDRGTPYDSSSR